MLLQSFSTSLLVVAAALVAPDGRILLQRRRSGGQHGGLWEFPGGKVERGETPERALLREIDEELGVQLDAAMLSPLAFAADAKAPPPPGRACVILLYLARGWAGEPECRAGEEIAWFDAGALAGLQMPPLDYPLADAVKREIAACQAARPPL